MCICQPYRGYNTCYADLGGAPLLAPGLVPGCAGHEGLALVDEGEHAGHGLLHPRVTLPGHRALLGRGEHGQAQEAGQGSDQYCHDALSLLVTPVLFVSDWSDYVIMGPAMPR